MRGVGEECALKGLVNWWGLYWSWSCQAWPGFSCGPWEGCACQDEGAAVRELTEKSVSGD